MGGTGLKEGREVQAEKGPESVRNAERARTWSWYLQGKWLADSGKTPKGTRTAWEAAVASSSELDQRRRRCNGTLERGRRSREEVRESHFSRTAHEANTSWVSRKAKTAEGAKNQ